jgi:hypothetical protein
MPYSIITIVAMLTCQSACGCVCQSTRQWATPGSRHIFWHLWPMDELPQTLSNHFWPSLTISEHFWSYTTFCDHLSTLDHYCKFTWSFTTCMQATSYIVWPFPILLSLKFWLSYTFHIYLKAPDLNLVSIHPILYISNLKSTPWLNEW